MQGPVAILLTGALLVTMRVVEIKMSQMNPADQGAYFLVIRLRKSASVRVGALGPLRFKPGWYVYVGSALNGLSARVGRHLRLHKAKRWHIDYLRPYAHSLNPFIFPSHRDIECVLARKLCRISDDQVPRFGSSDCACASHLFNFGTNPVFINEFRRLLKRNSSQAFSQESPGF